MSIQLLLDARHTLPALIVLFAGLDVLGSLLRPELEADTAGRYFKEWANKYMVSHAHLPCTAEDLWGARCGLLHTHTSASKLSREGKVRQLHYSRGPLPLKTKQGISALELKGKLILDVDALYGAFKNGCQRFMDDIQADSQLAKRVLHHSARLFGGWNYVP
jgi:hypothetical protein